MGRLILWVLVAHYIGDWILQPAFYPYMQDKHRSMAHLSLHVVTLTIPLAILGVALLGPSTGLLWAVLNGVAHGAVDAVTSRMTRRLYVANRLRRFWFVIGTDQTIHLITLVATWGWLGGSY